MFQDKQIKIFLSIAILIFIVLISIFAFNTQKSKNNKPVENSNKAVLSLTTDSNIFKINSVSMYSSANALNNNEMQKDYWDLNLYQYSDIAITIDNHVSIEDLTLKNTIKEMYIDNISYPELPDKGSPALYLKDANLFGKGVINKENLITDKINFNIISSNEEEFRSNLDFYADCSDPILLSSINEEIVPNFVIRNTNSAVIFDGNLLLDATILLSNIEYSLSFSIHIINELDEEYISTITIPIVLSDESDINSIYDGSYQVVSTDLGENRFYKRED